MNRISAQRTNRLAALAALLVPLPLVAEAPEPVRHCYDVPAKGERALLLTFDAPPYDPRKTVQLESSSPTARKPASPANP